MLGLSGNREGESRTFPLVAMSHLCELVRRHNRRSYEQVLAFDWGSYARFRRLGLDRLDSSQPEIVRETCRGVLELAVAELADRHPAAVDDV